jgi:hypothetical protein
MNDVPDRDTLPQAGGPPPLRPATCQLMLAIILDVKPSAEVSREFGLASQEHLEALYFSVLHNEITPTQLDQAMGNGQRLTELVNTAAHNPHINIKFDTVWDHIKPDDPGKVSLVKQPPQECGTAQSGVLGLGGVAPGVPPRCWSPASEASFSSVLLCPGRFEP